MRRAARRDENEHALVQVARQIGLKVFYTSELGDLVVQFGGAGSMPVTELWEVKNGDKASYTEAQVKLRIQGLRARRVETTDDVLKAKQEMMERLK